MEEVQEVGEFACTLCHFNCDSKIGLGQHINHRHPQLSNEKRMEKLKERGKVADKGGRSDYVWSEETTRRLRYLSDTQKNEASPLDEILRDLNIDNINMTRKQVRDKLRKLAIADEKVRVAEAARREAVEREEAARDRTASEDSDDVFDDTVETPEEFEAQMVEHESERGNDDHQPDQPGMNIPDLQVDNRERGRIR